MKRLFLAFILLSHFAITFGATQTNFKTVINERFVQFETAIEGKTFEEKKQVLEKVTQGIQKLKQKYPTKTGEAILSFAESLVQTKQTKLHYLESPKLSISPEQYQKILGIGMDVDWSKTKQGSESYTPQIVADFKSAGLSHVRIRIKDDISEELLSQLDEQIHDALAHELIPVIAYQGNDYKESPTAENLEKVALWWETVAKRYKDASHLVSYDLIIEPTDALNKDSKYVNALYEEVVSRIRKIDDERIIFIAPRVRSAPEYLKELDIPTKHNDFLMAEWHFYASGPSKTNESKLWTTGTNVEKQLIYNKIRFALEWENKTGIKTWVGAWMPGNYNEGDDYSIDEQHVFAEFVSCALLEKGIPFSFNSDIKFYNRENKKWIEETFPVLQTIIKGCKG